MVFFSPRFTDLLSAVGGQIEDKDGQKRDGDARDDEVNGVEESLAAYGDVEGDIRVQLRAARVASNVLHGRHVQDVPLHAGVEAAQVYTFLDDLLGWRLRFADVH